MKLRELHLSRPVYECLPWVYMLCGVLALAASYRRRMAGAFGIIVAVLGVAAVIGGVVVLLRRRDFRERSAQYEKSGSSLDS